MGMFSYIEQASDIPRESKIIAEKDLQGNKRVE
jgi:hypothetical protein